MISFQCCITLLCRSGSPIYYVFVNILVVVINVSKLIFWLWLLLCVVQSLNIFMTHKHDKSDGNLVVVIVVSMLAQRSHFTMSKRIKRATQIAIEHQYTIWCHKFLAQSVLCYVQCKTKRTGNSKNKLVIRYPYHQLCSICAPFSVETEGDVTTMSLDTCIPWCLCQTMIAILCTTGNAWQAYIATKTDRSVAQI